MYTKQQIIEEIKRVAIKLGVKSLKRRDFNKYSKISSSAVRYHFDSWNVAVKEAGLIPIDTRENIRDRDKIEDDKLFLDLIRLYNEYGKEPTFSLINAKGKYSVKPYIDRWKNIKNAFLLAKKKFPEEFTKNIQQSDEEKVKSQKIKFIPQTIKPQKTKKKTHHFWRTY